MKYISLGHLVLDERTVRDVEWEFSLDGQVTRTLEGTIPEWNYSSTVGVSCMVTVDLDEVRRTLEVANDLQLAWLLVAKCKPSPVAIPSHPIPLVDGRQEISLTLMPGSISGQLDLELLLTVASPSKFQIKSFAPNKIGQTVFRASSKLILEGNAGQLPLLPVSFAEHGIPHSESSLWWLRFLTRDLEESANSSLWLWLNTDNPEMEPLIEQSDTSGSLIWLQFLQVDFIRQLLSEALRHPDLDTSNTYPDGSLGELLSGVVKLVGTSIKSVQAEHQDDPGRVEAKLQALVNGARL